MRFLTLKQVCSMISCSRATIYRWVAAGMFPEPKKLSEYKRGRVAWLEEDVLDWMRTR